jgi:hypothetical protein
LAIVLIPLWWLWGWSYLLLFLALGISFHAIRQQKTLKMASPSLLVWGILAFGGHWLIALAIYSSTGAPLDTRTVLGSVNAWIAPGGILWFIQSQNIRVRLPVVAWAFSVVVMEMLLCWGCIYFLLHQGDYTIWQSGFALLTGKDGEFVPGDGNSNFLMPYFPEDNSIPGFVRYVFFFAGPESLALVSAFIILLATEVRSHLWTLCLSAAGIFILLLSGTRSVWVALPIVLTLRWLLGTGKVWGPWLVCLVLAIVSFSAFSVPPITNALLEASQHTATETAQLRGDSTAVRSEIYRRTWKQSLEGSDINFLLGYVATGETVLPGYAPAKVGSHSFYLGTLLYRRGLLGTLLFLGVWSNWLWWLYRTRRDRPLVSLLIMVLFSLVFCVMEFESVVMPLLLISAVLRSPPPNPRILPYPILDHPVC